MFSLKCNHICSCHTVLQEANAKFDIKIKEVNVLIEGLREKYDAYYQNEVKVMQILSTRVNDPSFLADLVSRIKAVQLDQK